MNLSRYYLRDLLLATGLSVTTLCVEAQEIVFGGPGPKVRAVIFHGNPLGGTKQGPTVKASNDVPATGVASIANGQVTGVKITSGGYYPRTEASWSGSQPRNLTLDVVFLGGGGSGASGKVELRLNSVGMEPTTLYWYVVKGVQITNPGSGYTSPPTVTFRLKP